MPPLQTTKQYAAVAAISVYAYKAVRSRMRNGEIHKLIAAQERLTGVQERLADAQHNLAEAQRRLAWAQEKLTASQRATSDEVGKLRDVYPYAEGKDPWEPPPSDRPKES